MGGAAFTGILVGMSAACAAPAVAISATVQNRYFFIESPIPNVRCTTLTRDTVRNSRICGARALELTCFQSDVAHRQHFRRHGGRVRHPAETIDCRGSRVLPTVAPARAACESARTRNAAKSRD